MKNSGFFRSKLFQTALIASLLVGALPQCAYAEVNPAGTSAVQTQYAYNKENIKNPLVTYKYTADPAVMSYNGRFYVYCSHDIPNTQGYQIPDVTCISSDDLVNWRDDGPVFQATRDSKWAKNNWAPACVARNGKFYLYYGNGGSGIGVAVADSPTGPFKDTLGKPLISSSMPNCSVEWLFDPGAFVDDDGQAYLYFGGGSASQKDADGNMTAGARVIKLNEDMISTTGTAITIPAVDHMEASYINKRNGKYYYSYSNHKGCLIDYMMSDNPMTGWTYKGTLLDNPPDNVNNNNHVGIDQLNGNWYIIYHNRKLGIDSQLPSNELPYARNTNIAHMYFNEDGTIKKVVPTYDGVEQIKNFDPYSNVVPAVTMNRESGILDEVNSVTDSGIVMDVNSINDGDWINVSNVDFGTGAASFATTVCSATTGGSIELRLDSPTGTLVGTCPVASTGDWNNWVTKTCNVSGATGVHSLYMVFKGGSSELFRMKSWQFSKDSSSTQSLAYIAADSNGYTLDASAGETHKIKVTATNTDGTTQDVTSQATFTQSNPDVLDISADGTVSTKGIGKDKITVTYGGKTDTIYVNVIDFNVITGLKTDVTSCTLRTGDTQKIIATATLGDNSTQDVTNKATITSKDTNIVTVNNGVITAVGKGTTQVLVDYKGKETSIDVSAYALDDNYSDEFNSSTLSGKWSWVNEDKSSWSLSTTSGALDITMQGGDLYEKQNNEKNVLIENAPAGDWIATTKLTYPVIPSENFQQSGLLVYQDDDNYIKFARSFNQYNGNKAFEYGSEVSGTATGGGKTVDDKVYGDTAYLQIQKKGDTYSLFTSPDDKNYTHITDYTSSLKNVKIGLYSLSNNELTNRIHALFDFVHVYETGATTTTTPTAIAAPTGLSSTAAGTDTINLGWTSVAGATGYNVYVLSTADGSYTKVNTNPITATTYSSTGLSANTAYYYKVTALNGDVESPLSDNVTATTSKSDATNPFAVKSTFNLKTLQPKSMLDVQTAVTNNGNYNQSVMAIVALYDKDDRMVSTSYISKSIPIGGTENLNAGFKLPDDVTGYKAKVFVWDGTDLVSTQMQPISNVVTLP